ncbi:MAG: Pectinesterase, partial [bacterium F083]
GVTVTATASEGYTFVGWTDANGSLLSSDAEWTLTLAVNQSYSWRVRANCGASDGASRWTEGNDFYLCGTFVVSEDNPFVENFAVDNRLLCWTAIGNNSAEHPSNWAIMNDSEGRRWATNGDYYGDIYLVSPAIQLPAEGRAKFSFTENIDYANYYSYDGQNSVYVVTEDGSVSTTEPVWAPETVVNGVFEREFSLDAYMGQTFRLIFKYEGNNAHLWGVTDVTVAMEPAYSVTAEVTATADARGTAAVSGDQGVTVTATASEGYTFVGWTDANGSLLSSDAEWTLYPTQDTTVYANFDTVSHTLTAMVASTEAGMGSVAIDGESPASGYTSVSKTVKYMSEHTLTATANTHYEFVKWNDEVTDNPRTVTMPNSDLTLRAIFSAVVTEVTDDQTVCDSYTLRRTDNSIVATYTQSGVYTPTYDDPELGRIHLTLTLTVNSSVHTATVETVCDSYTWVRGDGSETVLSESVLGEVYSYTDAHGCVSTDTLTLTVNRSSESTVEAQTGCDSYRYTYSDDSQSAEIFTESAADAWVVTTNAAGCDSTIHFALT